ncbi:prepilin-type N-terminal cleavage/methylation domain-containing protein [Pseudoduganella flava]|nr:shufflon system plasmid conjugative transfer pilus tip adhesin PilV [Pseudoduganella flava]TWI42469.1 prepilin-type N-terminal cleavage/methylation domain-containing protein [Pseudoduganella flava]
MNRSLHNGGFTLVELLATLAIGALLLAGLAGLVQGSLDDMKGQQAAYYQEQVAAAAREYLRANAAPLAVQAGTPATIVPVTVAQLRTARLLPDSFLDTNSYRQRTCVLVRQPDPVNWPRRFDALVVTSGGDPIGDKDIAAVAAQAGSGAGYIAATAPGTARGTAWQMQTTVYRGVTCTGSPGPALQGTAADAGHLVTSVFHDGAAQQPADYLYRSAVPGRPEVNRMNTALRFGVDALVTAGTSCLNEAGVAVPGIAMDNATRKLLTCGADGNWSQPSSWKDPVDTYATLTALPGSTAGDVRMVTSLSRAFTYDGAGWVALAVDQLGNFNVPGRSSANELWARQHVESEGGIHAKDHINTDRDINVGQDVLVKRNVEVDRDVVVKHMLQSKGVLVDSWLSSPAVSLGLVLAPGAACNYEEMDPEEGKVVIVYPYGTVVMDAAQRPLICGPDNTFRYSNGQYTIN